MVEEVAKRRIVHQIGRDLQREQLKARKISREALQYSSAQKLTKCADKELAKEVALSDQNVALEFTMQKTYKDPAKHIHLCPVFFLQQCAW